MNFGMDRLGYTLIELLAVCTIIAAGYFGGKLCAEYLGFWGWIIGTPLGVALSVLAFAFTIFRPRPKGDQSKPDPPQQFVRVQVSIRDVICLFVLIGLVIALLLAQGS